MLRELPTAVRMGLVTLLLTGLGYPLLVTVAARILFPRQAEGSLVRQEGRVVGSVLLAQGFEHPAYFRPRPSAAGADGYDGSAGSGSNLGPTSRRLRDRVAADLQRLRAENPRAPGPVPVELVTASASGLDPHLSPEVVRWQAPRVAEARAVPLAEVEGLVREVAEPRVLGLLGQPRVNVLRLNLALDRRFGPARSTQGVPGGAR